MGKTRSMNRKKKHDDDEACSKINTIKTCDNSSSVARPWSDLNHDVLSLVMMKLGVVDLFAFSSVCQSWRSLAASNKYKLIVSRPPMSLYISSTYPEKKKCYLQDFKGRKIEIIIPHSADRTCIGVTRGYLILYGEKTNDFWLVNLITRHELHFPNLPSVGFFCGTNHVRATLVFSPIISGWVFVILSRYTYKLWFSIAGKQEWTHVSLSAVIVDLHGLKGKIYILDSFYSLYEMILHPKPKWMLLETKNFPKPKEGLAFARHSENLYLINCMYQYPFMIHELDFGEMKWVSRENTRGTYTAFFSQCAHAAPAVIPFDRRFYAEYNYSKMWYFFHDCLNANLINE